MLSWHFPFWKTAQAADGENAETMRRLHVRFDYAATNQKLNPGLGLNADLVGIAVGLASKAAESVLDVIAAKTQAEAKTLEATVPVEGFYDAGGNMAIRGGTLRFHNGIDDDGTGATLDCTLRVVVSEDESAFRLVVGTWRHEQFLSAHTDQVAQQHDRRDFALKIEFLSPGSSGFGNRTVFIEQVFPGVEQSELKHLFSTDQSFPWFAAPVRPAIGTAAHQLPFNLHVTLVETTVPGRIATWIQEAVKDDREKVGAMVGGLVKTALDPASAADAHAKLATAAAAAFKDYKTAWDDLQALGAAPADATALAKWTADGTAKKQILLARKIVAQAAFGHADLPWPGDLKTA